MFVGRNVQCPDAEEIIYTLREREYVEKIEKAYNYASKFLLDLMMDEKELMARLRCVHKQYFVFLIFVLVEGICHAGSS